jgi:hypothetical protein
VRVIEKTLLFYVRLYRCLQFIGNDFDHCKVFGSEKLFAQGFDSVLHDCQSITFEKSGR